MSESGAGGAPPDADPRPRRVDRSRGSDRLRGTLAAAARLLAVLAAAGVVGELAANLLRLGVSRGAMAALLAVAAVAVAGALMARWPRSASRGARRRPAEDASARSGRDGPSRRTLRWQRRLGGAPEAGDGLAARQGRRGRRRRGGGGPTSDG